MSLVSNVSGVSGVSYLYLWCLWYPVSLHGVSAWCLQWVSLVFFGVCSVLGYLQLQYPKPAVFLAVSSLSLLASLVTLAALVSPESLVFGVLDVSGVNGVSGVSSVSVSYVCLWCP